MREKENETKGEYWRDGERKKSDKQWRESKKRQMQCDRMCREEQWLEKQKNTINENKCEIKRGLLHKILQRHIHSSQDKETGNIFLVHVSDKIK